MDLTFDICSVLTFPLSTLNPYSYFREMTKWDLQWSVSDPDTFVAFSTDKVEINFHRLTTKDEVSAGVVPWQQKQATKGELYLRSKADLQSVKVNLS